MRFLSRQQYQWAQTAIDEAVGGDSDLLKEAKKEMRKAAKQIQRREYDKAVENYFKAWEAALKSTGAL